MAEEDLGKLIVDLTTEMRSAAGELKFEVAARLFETSSRLPWAARCSSVIIEL
jgi:excinuclease UvrABC helicase subunit UvrB